MKLSSLIKQSVMDRFKPLSLILLLPLMSFFYNSLNHSQETVYSLVTDLDTMIPFVKYFVIPYVLWYPFLIFMLVYYCLKDRRVYYNVLVTMLIGLLINLITYTAFQTTIGRPLITGNDLFSNLVRLVYSVDQPYNCFPSGHVLTTYAVMYGAASLGNINRRMLCFSQVMGILIILSTQFIKQHTLLDAIASIVLVNIIKNLVEAWNPVQVSKWQQRILFSLTTRSR